MRTFKGERVLWCCLPVVHLDPASFAFYISADGILKVPILLECFPFCYRFDSFAGGLLCKKGFYEVGKWFAPFFPGFGA